MHQIMLADKLPLAYCIKTFDNVFCLDHLFFALKMYFVIIVTYCSRLLVSTEFHFRGLCFKRGQCSCICPLDGVVPWFWVKQEYQVWSVTCDCLCLKFAVQLWQNKTFYIVNCVETNCRIIHTVYASLSPKDVCVPLIWNKQNTSWCPQDGNIFVLFLLVDSRVTLDTGLLPWWYPTQHWCPTCSLLMRSICSE